MSDGLMPLYYAILKLFVDGREYDAESVVAALAPLYGAYKLLTRKDVEEALATARENALLDESGYDLDAGDDLRIRYRISEFGRDMIERYIGKYRNPS